jgi:hypothetical protein
VILFPIFYLLFMAFLGIVILACLPRFRVNALNVLLFTMGAVAGHLATALPIELAMYPRGFLRGIPEGFVLPVILLGAVGGGVGFVALIMKLKKT